MGHRFDPTILREYDIRGIVGETLSSADARAIGRAYALTLADAGGHRLAVGYDGRLTSPEFEAALVDGLAIEGADIVRIGLGPTPMLYYAAATLGVDGGIARSLQNMERLADLLASRGIPLTIVVYPWAQQIAQNDRDSRQVALWRDFCPTRCKAFINLFPVFFAAADSDKDWYEHLYILGDDHFSAAGNRMMFEELAKRLLP